MNEKQLYIFKLFVEHRNVSLVAEHLNVTQPTVSFHLKNLQDEVGIELYHKKGDQFSLTPAGEMLYKYSEEISALKNEAEQLLEEYKDYKRGTLKIGASQTPLNSTLPGVFRKYVEFHKDVSLLVESGNAHEIVELVHSRNVDFGIISENGIFDEQLQVERIFENPLRVVMDKSHPLASLDEIRAEDIGKYRSVIHRSGTTRNVIDKWKVRNNVQLNIAMEINSISSIVAIIKETEYIGFLVDSALENLNATNIVMKPLKHVDNETYISLVYRKDKFLTPIMKEFIYTVRNIHN